MENLEKIKKEFTGLINLELEGKTKSEIFLNIAKFAKQEGIIEDEQVVYQIFLEREQFGTTGIGNGIAIPEAAWIKMSRPYAFILLRTKEPVEFNSIDGKPVRMVLAALGGDKDKDAGLRLKTMARFSRLLKNNEFCNSFLKAKDVEEVYLLFRQYEDDKQWGLLKEIALFE